MSQRFRFEWVGIASNIAFICLRRRGRDLFAANERLDLEGSATALLADADTPDSDSP
jgi:hypothetical protein